MVEHSVLFTLFLKNVSRPLGQRMLVRDLEKVSRLSNVVCGLQCILGNYFDPYDIDGMAQALYQALQAPMNHDAKRARYEYSKNFSWQKTALATLDAFQSSVNV